MTGRGSQTDAFLAGTVPTVAVACASPPPASAPPRPVPPAAQQAAASTGTAPALPSAPQPPSGTPVAPGGNPPSPLAEEMKFLEGFRVRGTSDGLLVPRGSPAYASAAGATLSLSETGPKNTLNNALEAAVGYDYQFPQTSSGILFDLIPFVDADRNVTHVDGKESASSRDNVMLGVDFR